MDALFSNLSLLKLKGDINPQTRMVLHNVLTVFTHLKSDPDKISSLNLNKPRDITALLCGVSIRTVDNVKKEVLQSGQISSPRGTYVKPQTATNMDNFDVCLLRRTISSFYDSGEYPTRKKILEKMQEQLPEFKCARSSFSKILKNIGYKYKKNLDGRKYLMERIDIVCAKMDFLRKLDTLKKTNDRRPRFYVDETWVNQNHSRKRMWLGEDDQGGFKNQPVGKGHRLIVCHAGSAKTGFVPEAKLVFKAVKSKDADYHSEMDAERYMEWFKDLLQVLEEPSIIILDNASYHSKQLESIPTMSWRKNDIQDWLKKKNIAFSNADIKEELIIKVKQSNPKKIYAVDQLALEYGHEVIRLPPYHCQYNPIELIWAQVKGEVASKNSTFKIADVEILLHEAIGNVSTEDWVKCVKHAEDLQDQDLTKIILRDQRTQPFIINLQEDDSDWWSDDDID